MADMHCPICKAVNCVSWGVQIQCRKCGNWSHVDNWTYTKKAWARIEAKNKVYRDRQNAMRDLWDSILKRGKYAKT